MFDESFHKGKKYKVLADFRSGKCEFRKGEVLIFDQALYSPYDGAYAFEFIDENEKGRTWWVDEDASANEWSTFFELQ